VAAIVQDFYDEVLEDDELRAYFANTNMERLIHHQVQFISHVLGGPATYKGRDLRSAHASHQISSNAFDRVASILKSTLQTAGMSPEDVTTVMGLVEATRQDVVI